MKNETALGLVYLEMFLEDLPPFFHVIVGASDEECLPHSETEEF